MYKAKFYQRGKNRHPWPEPPVLDVPIEVMPGQKIQVKRCGKLWEVVDVCWCFKPGDGKSKFSHFDVGVI